MSPSEGKSSTRSSPRPSEFCAERREFSSRRRWANRRRSLCRPSISGLQASNSLEDFFLGEQSFLGEEFNEGLKPEHVGVGQLLQS